MGIYALQDIETDDGGELQFENGDLKRASVKRSYLQALNWIIMTNRIEAPVPDAVANIGAYQGSLNIPRTHRSIEASIRRAVSFQNLFAVDDLDVRMTPISLEDAALTVRMKGLYVEEQQQYINDPMDTVQVLGYLHPFENAILRRVS
jgi:hypothetical protein